ncbi:dnaJ homolog subfamily C member 24 [Aplochiton taeniatus]
MSSDVAQKDWYSVLGACPTDGMQALKQSYQRLALLYHPDRQGPDVSPAEAQHRLQRFLEVDLAWKTLSDPLAKRQYDLQRRASELNQSWPVECRMDLDEMTWDQDSELYTYGCRCGGQFCVGKEEVEQQEEEQGAIVCCDTCSLSIEVGRPT